MSRCHCAGGYVSEHETEKAKQEEDEKAKQLPVGNMSSPTMAARLNNTNVGKASTSQSGKTIEEGATCKLNKRLENVKL